MKPELSDFSQDCSVSNNYSEVDTFLSIIFLAAIFSRNLKPKTATPTFSVKGVAAVYFSDVVFYHLSLRLKLIFPFNQFISFM